MNSKPVELAQKTQNKTIKGLIDVINFFVMVKTATM